MGTKKKYGKGEEGKGKIRVKRKEKKKEEKGGETAKPGRGNHQKRLNQPKQPFLKKPELWPGVFGEEKVRMKFCAVEKCPETNIKNKTLGMGTPWDVMEQDQRRVIPSTEPKNET